jgi:hypothetical protein
MRSALTATLSVVATLAMISIASAEDNKDIQKPADDDTVLKPRREDTITKHPADAPYGGPTLEQHTAIPYHPCRDPSPKWLNGRLRCDNRY